MAIADTILELNDALQDAKTAITTAGGTVGDTGLAGLATEIGTIPSGGGGGIDPMSSDYGVLYHYSEWGDKYRAHDNNTGDFLFYFDTDVFKSFLTANNIPLSLEGGAQLSTVTGGGHPIQFYWSNMATMENVRVYFDSIAEAEAALGFTFPEGVSRDNWWFILSYAVEVDETSDIIPFVLADATDYQKLQSPSGFIQFGEKEIYKDAITAFYCGKVPTSSGNSFLRSCARLARVVLSDSIQTIGNEFCSLCHKLNSPILIPAGVTSIGNNFLFSCLGFNAEVSLPTTLTTIGRGFMSELGSFNQPLTLPRNISLIGGDQKDAGFLRNCRNMTSYVDVGGLDPSIVTSGSGSTNDTSFCAGPTQASYTTGITIKGSNRQAWLSRFPNSASRPYRKLIDGGA